MHTCSLPFSALGLAIALVGGCGVSTAKPTDTGAQGRQQPQLVDASDRVLVLPLRDGSCLPVYGNHTTCHITGEHLDAGNVPQGTGAEFGAILSEDLHEHRVPLIPYDLGVRLLSQADPAVVDRYEPSLAVQVGKQAHATKVIMGVVTRYEERSGTWFASRDPAAVAFSLALVDVRTGHVTHRLRFNRRQAPLAMNLLALPKWWQEGFAWWTREQVANDALAEAARSLAGIDAQQTPWTNMPARPSAPAWGERSLNPPSPWQ